MPMFDMVSAHYPNPMVFYTYMIWMIFSVCPSFTLWCLFPHKYRLTFINSHGLLGVTNITLGCIVKIQMVGKTHIYLKSNSISNQKLVILFRFFKLEMFDENVAFSS